MKFQNIIEILKFLFIKEREAKRFIINIYGLLQRQDLHRQKIERVVEFCLW